MKIAKKIREELAENGYTIDFAGDSDEVAIESIIAAKLKPVRDVLSKLRSMTAPDDCTCMVCEAADAALALLSEEE